MKRTATSLVIAAMTVGLAVLLVTRDRRPYDAPGEQVAEPVPDADAGDAAAASDAAPLVDAAPPLPSRPLRITTLGWDLAAAGVALSPVNAGAAPIELAPEASLDAVEGRLARGGEDPAGADVAVLPLPEFVASFDRLRALEPRAFLVVGFSRGREEVHAAPGAMLDAPPGGDEVKLVALGPATLNDPSARAAGSESATVFGLFALDLIGAAPARVRFVAPGAPDAASAPYSAIVRGAADPRKLALSTVDASRFVPIVAVAQRSVIDARQAALADWARAWLDGLARASKDVPGAARRLAAKDGLPLAAGVGGAPEALALVERLGRIEDVVMERQASYIGPRAKGAVTLEALAQRTWQLARAGGLVVNAAPDPLPIDPRVVAAIAPAPGAAPPTAEADAGVAFAPAPAGAAPLLAVRSASADVEEVAAQITFLSGVFERALFKITAKGGEKSARVIASAAHAKGVDASRLSTAAGEPRRALAVVEVLAPP